MARKHKHEEQQYQREYYLRNKEVTLARGKARREAAKAYVKEVKSVPCADCGVQYPYYVMEFDHREPHEKEFNIAKFVSSHSIAKLEREIAKCDIVCANCHRERHYGNEHEI
jgi:hypothetical protein